MGLRQTVHQRQHGNGNRGADQRGNTQLVEQAGVDRQRLERVGDIAWHAGKGSDKATEILRDTGGDKIGAHHEAAHACRHVTCDHRQAKTTNQQFTQRDSAVAPHHQPRGYLARAVRKVTRRTVDKEAGGHQYEAKGELGGYRDILAGITCTRVSPGQNRAENKDPDRVKGLELSR